MSEVPFQLVLDVRWSDLDPNQHVRHSVYYDWGAQARMAYLGQQGLSLQWLRDAGLGLVLLREECVFRKEIRPQDHPVIDLQLLQARPDFSRWAIRHRITREPGQVGAIITVEGAWINTAARRLAAPPEPVIRVFNQIQRAEDFQWLQAGKGNPPG
ncbi:MAG TPA: thioesterase family protein [Chitinophagaceae bacterium]|nr:thioesterase family protein [Chitinophagaceae bacterium]